MSARASGNAAPAPAAPGLDPVLVVAAVLLLGGGLVMLTSASISIAERSTGNPFFYLERQLLAAAIGLAAGAVAFRVPSDAWSRIGPLLAAGALAMLALVLVPGVGQTVNGSTRWVRLGGFAVQVAEPARLLLLMYLAGYAVRHGELLKTRVAGFLRPLLPILVACALLLAQPDFGSVVVLVAVSVTVLFVAGARLVHLAALVGAATAAGVALAVTSPYRMARITAFLDPWADPFASGFQLTQSLIAIGTGEWLGVGLGGSVQKLFYLPEAHTDFVFAVIAEELGLAGSLGLIALFAVLVWRALLVAEAAAARRRVYAACFAFGFATWQGLQALVNVGVNMGLLPTKGLTLPLVSYGRSSLIVTLIGLALLLRIDAENRTPVRGRRKAG